MTYKEKIICDMKNGAILKCTEGKKYKAWLEYANGEKKTIRRDTASKISVEFMEKLDFTNYGIKFKIIN